MTTVEILKHHLKNRIDFGYFPFSDWSNMINDAIEVAIAALEKPAPFQSMDFDDIADEIESELVRYATEESEYWHHWRIGVMDGLKKAQSMMPAPVYHYLPEVPEDGEEVIGYSDTYGIEVLKFFKKDNAFMDAQLYETTGVYAWTRIPPKPPVKEGGINGK